MRQKQLILRLGVLSVGLLLLLALWKHFRELNEPVLAEPVILVPAEREPVPHEPIPPEPDLFEPFIPELITLELIYPESINPELVPPETVNPEPINPEPVPTSSRPTRAIVDADLLTPAARKLQMLRDGRAAPFREATCDYCNTIPKPQTWACAPPRSNGSLGVYAVTRRMGQFARWEPFYIGTHDDPVYDERLTWNGMRDKRIQAYVMCLKDYSFHVLDNAFLVHRPGIEVSKDMKWRKNHIDKANSMIASKIVPQYAKWFGKRKGCEV